MMRKRDEEVGKEVEEAVEVRGRRKMCKSRGRWVG